MRFGAQKTELVTHKSDFIENPVTVPDMPLDQQQALIVKAGIRKPGIKASLGKPVILSARNPISSDHQIFLNGYGGHWFPDTNAVVLQYEGNSDPTAGLLFLGGCKADMMVMFGIESPTSTQVTLTSFPNHTVTQIQGTGATAVMPVVVPKGTDSVFVSVPAQGGSIAIIHGVYAAPIQ